MKQEILNKIEDIKSKGKKPSMTVRFTPEEKAKLEYLAFLTGEPQSDLLSRGMNLLFEVYEQQIKYK